MANIIPVGISVGFIHDVSDIFVGVCKGFHLAGYENIGCVFFLSTQFMWFIMRLMAFPTIIRFLIDLKYNDDRAYLQIYMTMSWILLSFLLVLHIFWFFIFQKMNYLFFCKGEANDL